MNPIADHAQRIANLESKVNNILQEGIVKKIRADENLLDIEVKGIMLEKVPYLTMRAGSEGQSYWMPEMDESGLLLCPDGQAGNAIFLPALNTESNMPPVDEGDRQSDPERWKLVWKAGREIEYKGDDDELIIKIDSSEIKIETDKLTLKQGTTELEVSGTQIKGFVNGIGVMLLTAALSNIAGATFANGVTNLAPTVPISYPPVPIT